MPRSLVQHRLSIRHALLLLLLLLLVLPLIYATRPFHETLNSSGGLLHARAITVFIIIISHKTI